MPTSKRAKSSPPDTEAVVDASGLAVGDVIKFQWRNGDSVVGRVLKLCKLPLPGAVLGPVDQHGVRLMKLAVTCYDEAGYVIERNGDALFKV